MESEFIALDKCGEEVEWLRQFVEDIPRWPKLVTAISIHCDSQSTIGRDHSTMYNGKSRHIRRRHNSIRQLLSTGVISIDYVKLKDNIVDPLTKGFSRELVIITTFTEDLSLLFILLEMIFYLGISSLSLKAKRMKCLPIPKDLITEAIQQSSYYQQYLEMVARNTKDKDGEKKKTASEV
ncbi:hypothetical protein Tco_0806976 [Tanacetum coccineum]